MLHHLTYFLKETIYMPYITNTKLAAINRFDIVHLLTLSTCHLDIFSHTNTYKEIDPIVPGIDSIAVEYGMSAC